MRTCKYRVFFFSVASIRKGGRFYSYFYTIHDFSFTGISFGILPPALFDVQMTVDVADDNNYAEIFGFFLSLDSEQPSTMLALRPVLNNEGFVTIRDSSSVVVAPALPVFVKV